MQLWKWMLVIGLLFLITYNPSSGGKVGNFFNDPMVGGNDEFSNRNAKGTT